MNTTISFNKMLETLGTLVTKAILYKRNHIYLSEWSIKAEFVRPLLEKCLGYDFECGKCIQGEFYCDVKQDKRTQQKCDFAILNANTGVIDIIVECKNSEIDITKDISKNQIFNYLNSCETAKIGILTNGYEFVFYRKIGKEIVMMWDFNMRDIFSMNDILERCNSSNIKLLELLSMTKTVSIISAKKKICASNYSFVNEAIQSKVYDDYNCVVDSDIICAISTQYLL